MSTRERTVEHYRFAHKAIGISRAEDTEQLTYCGQSVGRRFIALRWPNVTCTSCMGWRHATRADRWVRRMAVRKALNT